MLVSKMNQVRFQSTLESAILATHPYDPLFSHQTHTEPIPHYWSPREDDPSTITKSRTSTFDLVGNGAFTDTKGERFSQIVYWNSNQADEISCFALPQQDSETMAAQIYSKNDLLRMRQASAEVELQKNLRNKLKGKVDLSKLRQNPHHASNASLMNDGDDIVRAPGRGHRKLGRIPEEPRDVPVEKALALAPTSVRQLDGTDSEWKYRGRSDSEDAQPQPISAPTGIAAQRDEGFQRFYRAVVSPTHVRVTAGGRIVPNNRATFSPNPKWAKDKPMSDTAPSHRVAVQGQTEHPSFQFPHVNLGPVPQMYPGFAPGPGVAPVPPPYTFIPWHMGMGMSMGANFGMPITPTPVVGANPALKKHRDATSSEQQSESSTLEKEASAASPLDFYDHTRSILLNNQWMIPPTAPFYPVPLAPSHGFNGMAIPAPSAAPGGGNRDMDNAKKSDQSMENKGLHHPSFSKMATTGTAPQSNSTSLPISSIRPSEITRRHLDILRARLRYLEDQLQFNKHQIDERAVENDAQLARQFIQQFETNFEMQYNLEESFYPKAKEMEAQRSYDATPKPSENFNHQNLATANNCRSGSDYGAFCQDAMNDEAKPHHGSQNASDSSLHRQALSGNLKREKSETRFGSGINSTKSVSAFAGSQPLTGSLRSSRSGTEKSRLPLDAALAPPFQPRSETMLQTYNKTFANSAGGFGKPGSGVEAVNNPTASLSGERVSWDALSTPCVPQEDRVPYLVGHLPNGIGMDRAQVTDFTYERELTEDELRARHMYWGKAPHDLQKGLPKFNGKDFFPPSPLKDHSADSAITRKMSTQAGKKAMSTLQEQTLVADPFKLLGQSGHLFSRDGPGNSTQSETLPGPEHSLLRAAVAGAHHDGGGALKRGGNSLDEIAAKNPFRLAKLPVVDPKESSSSDECDEDRELLFKGRKAMQHAKTHNRIWSSMLNKGNSSAGAVPGAVSTTTAQGVLPQYSGHATASLTPTISNNKASSRTNLAKPNDAYHVKTNDMLQGHQSENRPPGFNNAGGKR